MTECTRCGALIPDTKEDRLAHANAHSPEIGRISQVGTSQGDTMSEPRYGKWISGPLNAYVEHVVRRASGHPEYDAKAHAEALEELDHALEEAGSPRDMLELDLLRQSDRLTRIALGSPGEQTTTPEAARIIGEALEHAHERIAQLEASAVAPAGPEKP